MSYNTPLEWNCFSSSSERAHSVRLAKLVPGEHSGKLIVETTTSGGKEPVLRVTEVMAYVERVQATARRGLIGY